jgi:hypothetical protein
MKNIRLVSLFAAAALAGGAIVALAQTVPMASGLDFTRITPETVKWQDYAGDGAQFGIKEAFIYGDPTKPGLYIIRLKFPPGVMSSPHYHPDDRIGTVISGTWYTGIGDKFDPASATAIPTGGIMVHPKGKMHYDGSRDTEVVVQMMGIGPSGKTVAVPGSPGFMRVK